MAGYIGTKAALLSTTAASVGGDSTVGGDLTVDTDTLYVDSANNRVGIGNTSPTQALDVTGDIITSGGVYLGGVGSANYLDDYEEGTWTPAVSAGVNSITYSQRQGYYRKIGSFVYVDFYIQLSGTGSGTHFQINGLPFTTTTAGGGYQRGGGVASYQSVNPTVGTVSFYGNQGVTYFYVYHTGNTNFSTTSSLSGAFFIGTYTYISA